MGGPAPAPDRLPQPLREDLRVARTRARGAPLHTGWPPGADVATKLIADTVQSRPGPMRTAPAQRPVLVDEALNVFRIHGTAMRPNILLMAKLVTLAFLFSGQIVLLSHHFVPFIGLFRHLGSPSAFHLALELVFLAAAASLLLNHRVRIACIVLGGVIVVSIASSM